MLRKNTKQQDERTCIGWTADNYRIPKKTFTRGYALPNNNHFSRRPPRQPRPWMARKPPQCPLKLDTNTSAIHPSKSSNPNDRGAFRSPPCRDSDGHLSAMTSAASIKIDGNSDNDRGGNWSNSPLEEGEISKYAFRRYVSRDDKLPNDSDEESWEEVELRLVGGGEDDPEALFSSGDSKMHGPDEVSSHTLGAIVAPTEAKESDKKRQKTEYNLKRQNGTEMRFSVLGDGNLCVNSDGVEKINGCRLNGTAKPISCLRDLFEATISNNDMNSKGTAGRSNKKVPIKTSSPTGFPLTEPWALPDPETPKSVSLKVNRQERDGQSKLLTSQQPSHQEEADATTSTAFVVEKTSERKIETMKVEETSKRTRETKKEVKETSSTDDSFWATTTVTDFQREILLLSHASSCRRGRRCEVNYSCAQLKSLWKHISDCNQDDCEICESASYKKYKNIWNHYKHCTHARCGYCAPVREIVSSLGQWSGRRRQVQIRRLLQTQYSICPPANPTVAPRQTSPRRHCPTEQTVKSATASTRLWSRYSEDDVPQETKMMAKTSPSSSKVIVEL